MLIVILIIGFIITNAVAWTETIKRFDDEQTEKAIKQLRKTINIDVN